MAAPSRRFDADCAAAIRAMLARHNERHPGARAKFGELKKVWIDGWKGRDPNKRAMRAVERHLDALAKTEFDESKVRRDEKGRFAPKYGMRGHFADVSSPHEHSSLKEENAGYKALQTEIIPETRFTSTPPAAAAFAAMVGAGIRGATADKPLVNDVLTENVHAGLRTAAGIGARAAAMAAQNLKENVKKTRIGKKALGPKLTPAEIVENAKRIGIAAKKGVDKLLKEYTRLEDKIGYAPSRTVLEAAADSIKDAKAKSRLLYVMELAKARLQASGVAILWPGIPYGTAAYYATKVVSDKIGPSLDSMFPRHVEKMAKILSMPANPESVALLKAAEDVNQPSPSSEENEKPAVDGKKAADLGKVLSIPADPRSVAVLNAEAAAIEDRRQHIQKAILYTPAHPVSEEVLAKASIGERLSEAAANAYRAVFGRPKTIESIPHITPQTNIPKYGATVGRIFGQRVAQGAERAARRYSPFGRVLLAGAAGLGAGGLVGGAAYGIRQYYRDEKGRFTSKEKAVIGGAAGIAAASAALAVAIGTGRANRAAQGVVLQRLAASKSSVADRAASLVEGIIKRQPHIQSVFKKAEAIRKHQTGETFNRLSGLIATENFEKFVGSVREFYATRMMREARAKLVDIASEQKIKGKLKSLIEQAPTFRIRPDTFVKDKSNGTFSINITKPPQIDDPFEELVAAASSGPNWALPPRWEKAFAASFPKEGPERAAVEKLIRNHADMTATAIKKIAELGNEAEIARLRKEIGNRVASIAKIRKTFDPTRRPPANAPEDEVLEYNRKARTYEKLSDEIEELEREIDKLTAQAVSAPRIPWAPNRTLGSPVQYPTSTMSPRQMEDIKNANKLILESEAKAIGTEFANAFTDKIVKANKAALQSAREAAAEVVDRAVKEFEARNAHVPGFLGRSLAEVSSVLGSNLATVRRDLANAGGNVKAVIDSIHKKVQNAIPPKVTEWGDNAVNAAKDFLLGPVDEKTGKRPGFLSNAWEHRRKILAGGLIAGIVDYSREGEINFVLPPGGFSSAINDAIDSIMRHPPRAVIWDDNIGGDDEMTFEGIHVYDAKSKQRVVLNGKLTRMSRGKVVEVREIPSMVPLAQMRAEWEALVQKRKQGSQGGKNSAEIDNQRPGSNNSLWRDGNLRNLAEAAWIKVNRASGADASSLHSTSLDGIRLEYRHHKSTYGKGEADNLAGALKAYAKSGSNSDAGHVYSTLEMAFGNKAASLLTLDQKIGIVEAGDKGIFTSKGDNGETIHSLIQEISSASSSSSARVNEMLAKLHNVISTNIGELPLFRSGLETKDKTNLKRVVLAIQNRLPPDRKFPERGPNSIKDLFDQIDAKAGTTDSSIPF